MSIKCPKCHHENQDDTIYCGKCTTPLKSSEDIEVTATIETPKEELTTGSTFAGRYQIIEELGRGGMGRVYKALDTEVNEKIALKLIKPEIAADKKTIERFRNELKFARKIRHKNVCQMYDLSKVEGSYYITMEYVGGDDLKGMIRRMGRFSAGQAITTAKQVCEGLTEAHKLGVVHRDLKPQNIMIDQDGNARIMDFGIARSIEGKSITGAGVMIGTPDYMSPEQVDGKETDQRSDVYSLGVILFEMVTGRAPFEGDTALSIAVKHKTEIPPDPRKYNEQLSEELSQIILRCLEKDKENRYQSAGEVISNLDSIEKGLPTTERIIPERKPLTSREITVKFSLKKAFIPILIVISIVILGIVIWQLLPQRGITLGPKIENSIAVVSFENQTGNTELDHLQKMIPNLIITNLENTGLFYVATWERMSDLLRQIENRNVEIIDSELGFKLCQEEGIESIVVGSYSQAGNVFVTDIKVLDVDSRKLIKSASSTGEGIDSILKTQINVLSRTIAEGLGLAREKIDTAQLKIEDVATTSLEAYKYYLEGRDAETKWDNIQALRSYEKATELDPNFAYAYRRQAVVHGKFGNSQKRQETIRKAKNLSHHATEKQRMYIEAAYAQFIEEDNEKRLRIYQQIVDKYPKEKGIYYNLGLYYSIRSLEKAVEYLEKALELDPNYASACNELGYEYLRMNKQEEAIELFERYASIIPGSPNPLDSLADAYFQTGRIDEALAKYIEITETYPEFYSSNMGICYIYALRKDYDEAIKWIDRYILYAPSLVLKGRGSLFKSLCLSWSGRYADAFKELEIASNLAEAADSGFLKAQAEWMKGCVHLDRGEYELSRSSYKNFFDSEDVGGGFRLLASLSFSLLDIRQGVYDSAKQSLPQMKSFLSELTSYEGYWEFHYDYFKAEVLLAEKRYDEAINQFNALSPPSYYLFPRFMILYNHPGLRDISARAFLEKGNIDKAITEYEKLINFNPDSKGRFLIHPKYYYRLAKLYQKRGDTTKAIKLYEKFLDLWKDADPGIAEVEDAKKRLTGLKSH